VTDPKEVIERLQKSDGDLTVQLGREGDIIAEPTGYVSTRCPVLDFLIGRPGVPLGGISLWIGAYGSGKSTICLNILAEIQTRGGLAVVFDTEGRFSFSRAEKFGIDLDKLIIAQPDTLEELFKGLKRMIEAIRDGSFDQDVVIVVDGIAGAPLEKEAKGEKTALGAQSFLIRKELRVLTMLVNRQRIGLVITTQPRQKINLGGFTPSRTSWMGEDPLGHAALTTILLEKKSKIGDDPASPIGHVHLATLIDTRIAGCTDPECKTCCRKDFKRTFDFYSATGPDFYGSALDVLMEAGEITHTSGWYRFRDPEKKEKGFRRDDFEQVLLDKPEILEALSVILQGGHPPVVKEKTS